MPEFDQLPDFLTPLIKDYLDNRHSELKELRRLFLSNDLVAIRKIGHKLAGNAASYGLKKLGEIGDLIEKCEAIETIETLLIDYENELKIAQKDYEDFFTRKSSSN